MRHFYRLSSNAQSKPIRLIASVALASVVMTFINGFIGGMGGIPSFIAYSTVFYLLRTIVSAGNRITHQLGITSKREIGYLLKDYAAGYLLLWTLLRIGLTFSRVTGWGNLNGASALSYVQEIAGSSILEKWADLFAGVFMFAFVVSLFPLVVIRRRNLWTVYALMDGACFALVCALIERSCRRYVGESVQNRGICLIDELLMCGGLTDKQKILCLAGITLFTAAVGVFVFFFAAYCYGPKKAHAQADASRWPQQEFAKRRRMHANLALLCCSVLSVGIVGAIVLLAPEDTAAMYDKVAEYMTGDAALGPMVYGGRLYAPVDEELSLFETGTPQGYVAKKGEDCGSRIYELTVANVLYLDPTGKTEHVQMYGADVRSFAPLGELETAETWRRDEVFLLWDEDWEAESAYFHEPTGYTVCDQAFVKQMEEQFGQVAYHVGDFADYDAYFTLCGYENLERALTEDHRPGDWVGCVLVKDDKFYYGNYENPITGESLQLLLDILGGYEK